MIYVAFKWSNDKKYGDGWRTIDTDMPQTKTDMVKLIERISRSYDQEFDTTGTNIVIYYLYELRRYNDD